ncbi:argonaute 5, partial [Dionaea muscipula]
STVSSSSVGRNSDGAAICDVHAERATLDYVVVPPAYYAHLAAFRAHYYLEDEAH